MTLSAGMDAPMPSISRIVIMLINSFWAVWLRRSTHAGFPEEVAQQQEAHQRGALGDNQNNDQHGHDGEQDAFHAVDPGRIMGFM